MGTDLAGQLDSGARRPGWSVLLILSFVGLLLSIGALVDSSIVALPILPQGVLIAVVVLLLPVWVAAILWLVRTGRKESNPMFYAVWRPMLRRTPRSWRVLASLAIALLVLAFLSSVSSVLMGNPEVHDGQYFLNSHGALTTVSQQAYEDSLRAHIRFTASVLTWFFLLGALVLLSASGERRRAE